MALLFDSGRNQIETTPKGFHQQQHDIHLFRVLNAKLKDQI